MQKCEKTFELRSYECDKDGFLRIVTLMNILQDAADLSATSLGFGFDFCIQNSLAWMGTNYHIKINRLPTVHEKIKVQTWPSGENKFMALRDFLVFDEKGIEIIKATSQWVLINFEKKRPVTLTQYLPQFMYIDERVLGTEFSKLPDLTKTDFSKKFAVRFDDIDLNQHVNNAIYPLWASEALPENFHQNNKPCEIEITYKKECHFGEEINIQTEIEEKSTLHSISSLSDGRELARLRFYWQKKI